MQKMGSTQLRYMKKDESIWFQFYCNFDSLFLVFSPTCSFAFCLFILFNGYYLYAGFHSSMQVQLCEYNHFKTQQYWYTQNKFHNYFFSQFVCNQCSITFTIITINITLIIYLSQGKLFSSPSLTWIAGLIMNLINKVHHLCER